MKVTTVKRVLNVLTILVIIYSTLTLITNNIEIKRLNRINHTLEADNLNLEYQVRSCRQLVSQ